MDVLIIGAGPVGLTLAIKLQQYGLTFRIIDKKPEPTQTSNAVGIHARTLELFTNTGLTETFIQQGNRVNQIEMGTQEKKLATWRFELIDSIYPFVLDLPQKNTEAILIERLSKHGIAVERNKTLSHLTQTDTEVTATLTQEDGSTEAITASYLVGCDGFHSGTREILGTAYEGGDLPLNFMMIDSPIEWEQGNDTMYAYFTDRLSLAMFPLPGSMRMIAEVSHAPEYVSDALPDETVFNQICKEVLPYPIHVKKPLWASHFMIHERLASNYRKQRVFLAGDAAHAHSPAGGQGMNTGMHDAFNLSWKLAQVIKHKANDALLDTYNEERRPVARMIIDNAEKMTKVGMTRHKIFMKVRDFILEQAAKINQAQEKFVNLMAEKRIHYRKSSLTTHSRHGKLSAGDPAPSAAFNDSSRLLQKITSEKYLLLNFTEQEVAVDDTRIDVLHISKDESNVRKSYQAHGLHYCLIRPDYYIAYIGNDLEKVILTRDHLSF